MEKLLYGYEKISLSLTAQFNMEFLSNFKQFCGLKDFNVNDLKCGAGQIAFVSGQDSWRVQLNRILCIFRLDCRSWVNI